MSDRLTKSDWIAHGLRALAEDGPNALKIGRLADGLGVSRGSFYWHFRDIVDFRTQLLDAWRDWTTQRVIRELEEGQDEADRLAFLMRRAFAPSSASGLSIRSLDRVVRAWALQDREIAALVAKVDEDRIGYIADLLVSSGVRDSQAKERAAFLYWAYMGQPMVMSEAHASLSTRAIGDICDLLRSSGSATEAK